MLITMGRRNCHIPTPYYWIQHSTQNSLKVTLLSSSPIFTKQNTKILTISNALIWLWIKGIKLCLFCLHTSWCSVLLPRVTKVANVMSLWICPSRYFYLLLPSYIFVTHVFRLFVRCFSFLYCFHFLILVWRKNSPTKGIKNRNNGKNV